MVCAVAALPACSWPTTAVLLDAPTAIAPVSGSVLSSQYPTFRWRTHNPAIDTVQIEICATVACEGGPVAVEEAPARDGYYVRQGGLLPGSYFWRIRGMHSRVVSRDASPPALFVIRTTVPSVVPGRVMGNIVDVDRDGRADVVTTEDNFCSITVASNLSRPVPGITVFPAAEAPAPRSTETWLPVRTRAIPSGGLASGIVSLGDCDGDGLLEFAYPSPGAGDVQIFEAGAGTASLTRSAVLAPPASDIQFGSVVSFVHDADLDGSNEIVARGNGRVYVARLTPDGPAREPPRQIVRPADWDDSAGFGSAVASPGDLDGDGAGDLLVGAPGARSVGIHLGLRGSTLIVGNQIRRIDAPPGLTRTARFGAALSSGGDVDGDGVPDIAIGAPTPDGSTDLGAALIFSTPGMPGTPLVPIVLGQVNAPDVGDGFGSVVRSAGDFNGDGVGDLAVGAPFYVRDGVVVGRVYVYLGARAPAPALPAVPSVILEDPSTATNGFGSAISSAGDIDGDGLDDIAVGEPRFDQGAGRVLVFRGDGHYARPGTVVAEVAWTLSPPRDGSGICAGRTLAMR